MRQSRSNGRAYALCGLVIFALLFVYLVPASNDPSRLTRQRKSDAAASNPLSPPTSAFRKQGLSGANGVRIPPPVVHYQLNNLTASPEPQDRNEKILILTPLARFYQAYWDNLLSLSYPHEHISL